MIFVSACQLAGQRIADLDKGQHLSDLKALPLPKQSPVTDVDIGAVIAGYQAALRWVEDPVEKEKIARRLAVLQLREADEQQILSANNNSAQLYANVIVTYQKLLTQQASRDDADQLLYPLAKAYEHSGNLRACLQTLTQLVTQYPRSKYYVETQFRRAELLFSMQRYQEAFTAYEAVYLRDREDNLANNAIYMAGWSQFKLANYEQAVTLFATLLDRIGFENYARLRVDSEVLVTADEKESPVPDIKGNRERLQHDVFRVMAYAFSYAGGAKDIDRLMNNIGERDYAYLLYQDLGWLYLDKKRFRDSALAFEHYVQRYPLTVRAPRFKQWQIEAFARGGFPAEVRKQKKLFATSYAIDAQFWQTANATTRQFIRGKLETYIDELARYHHAMAQRGLDKNPGNKDVLVTASVKKQDEKSPVEHYAQAAIWYESWIKSFPDHPERLQRWFLLGEVRSQSGSYVGAIKAYEHAAYVELEQPQIEHSAPLRKQQSDAGYAAWLLYDSEIARHGSRVEQRVWQEKKISSAMQFANAFTADTRLPALLAKTTNEHFALQNYVETIETADRLLQMPRVDDELLISVLLASAHASTQLQRYDAAEHRYSKVLALLELPANHKQHTKHYAATLDNYAASIYRQGELMAANNAMEEAANDYLRVASLAPKSSLAATALHDAGVLFGQLEQWPEAISAMEALAQQYPAHAGVKALPARLLHARQSIGDYRGAAAQAIIIAQTDHDPELRRQALYSAAELYQRADDTQAAISAYREYAHSYQKPISQRFEAMYQLSLLYETTGQTQKRDYWLNQLVSVNAKINKPTQRSNYLAGYAQKTFAQKHFTRYKKLALTQPIKESLPEKRKVMSAAIEAYKKLAAYDIAEYSLFATHQMGEIYRDLAVALLESERPLGLDALALEQYELLLEEQAFPFEEQAIKLFMVNVERCWQSICDASSARSYKALAKLIPARFDKLEKAREIAMPVQANGGAL